MARVIFIVLTLATVVLGVLEFGRMLASTGWGILDPLLLGLFALLFLWIAASFWIMTIGFAWRFFRPGGIREEPAPPPDPAGTLPPTVLVMPIYNEDPHDVLAGVAAMWESLQATGFGDSFDVFVLSDTTNAETWLQEEEAWAVVRERLGPGARVFYRHRERREGRKSGNLTEFCRRWGGRYEFMVVLDADSLMAGSTIVELVRRMVRQPDLGLLQVPPVPVNRMTLFARTQQFAAAMYGCGFTAGFQILADTEGTYWGHNAIIRVRPFAECCGLPVLPGSPPLGGEILSHDFVEAALMRRKGWKVRMDSELGGSFETCPANLEVFAKRNQRWCLGNLQHLRLVLLSGFHPISRLHFGMGSMAYLSSPLWLLFVLLAIMVGVWQHAARAGDAGESAGTAAVLPLLIGTAVLLFAPKLWAGLLMLRRRDHARKLGGFARVFLSIAAETIVSVLIAPILMVFNVLSVAAILLGRTVQWDAQDRGESGLRFGAALRAYSLHTNGGIVLALLTAWLAPGLVLWLLPIYGGLILSVPLAMALSSPRLGRSALDVGLFLTPAEVERPQVLRAQLAHRVALDRSLTRRRGSALLRALVDPVFSAFHVAVQKASGGDRDGSIPPALRGVVLYGGPKRLDGDERLRLLADTDAIRWLHRKIWSRWPDRMIGVDPARRPGNRPKSAAGQPAEIGGRKIKS